MYPWGPALDSSAPLPASYGKFKKSQRMVQWKICFSKIILESKWSKPCFLWQLILAQWEFSFLLRGPAFCTCLSVLGLLMMNGVLSYRRLVSQESQTRLSETVVALSYGMAGVVRSLSCGKPLLTPLRWILIVSGSHGGVGKKWNVDVWPGIHLQFGFLKYSTCEWYTTLIHCWSDGVSVSTFPLLGLLASQRLSVVFCQINKQLNL